MASPPDDARASTSDGRSSGEMSLEEVDEAAIPVALVAPSDATKAGWAGEDSPDTGNARACDGDQAKDDEQEAARKAIIYLGDDLAKAIRMTFTPRNRPAIVEDFYTEADALKAYASYALAEELAGDVPQGFARPSTAAIPPLAISRDTPPLAAVSTPHASTRDAIDPHPTASSLDRRLSKKKQKRPEALTPDYSKVKSARASPPAERDPLHKLFERAGLAHYVPVFQQRNLDLDYLVGLARIDADTPDLRELAEVHVGMSPEEKDRFVKTIVAWASTQAVRDE